MMQKYPVKEIRFSKCKFHSKGIKQLNQLFTHHSNTLKGLMFHGCLFSGTFFSLLNLSPCHKLEKFELTSACLNGADFYPFFSALPNSIVSLSLNQNKSWMEHFIHFDLVKFKQPTQLKQVRLEWNCCFKKERLISFISKFTPDVEIELVGNCQFLMEHFVKDLEEQLGKRQVKIVATDSEQFQLIEKESDSESESELESEITRLNNLLFRRE